MCLCDMKYGIEVVGVIYSPAAEVDMEYFVSSDRSRMLYFIWCVTLRLVDVREL